MTFPTPGATFHTLRVEREIGEGAFGKVFLAVDPLIGRKVALKAVRGEPEVRERILREARLVGQLVHPNIVTLYRVHPPEGTDVWGFEFEFVEGGTLHDLLASGTPPLPRQTEIACGIARGLAAAHRAGIVHGDVKPGNVLLAADGTPKLADFGLGQLLGDLAARASDSDVPAGTPAFMAPEVLLGDAVRPASDVWSLGVVLYALACGRRPFHGANLHALMYAIQNSDPPPPPPHLPAALTNAIRACLGKRPSDRPRDAGAVAAILDGEIVAVAPRRAPRSRLRGREREEATLHERLRAAAARREGSCTLVTGEPGIGKTALATEVSRAAQELGLPWIAAGVSAIEGVVRPLLRAVSGQESGDPRLESTREQIGRMLEQSDRLRIDASQPVVGTLERMLGEMLERRGLGLLLEDLHECNEEDVRIAIHVAGRVAAQGGFVLLLARAGVPELGSQPFVEAMPLEALAREEGYALLEDHAGKTVAPRIARLVHEKAAGNPRHMLELFRHMLEGGSIRVEGGQIVESEGFESADLPRGFRDIVAGRLGRLSEGDRDLLEMAAVAGAEFDGADLAAVAERPLLHVLRELQRIYRQRGLVVPLAQGYRFSSPIVRDVIYEEVGPDLRRVLHRRFAEALSGREDVDPERLAVHWECSGARGRAAPYFLEAAMRATRRLERRRSMDLAARGGLSAATLGPDQARDHRDLLLAIAGFHNDLGLRDDAEHIVKVLVDAALAVGDEPLRLRALVRQAQWRYRSEGSDAVDLDLLERAGRELGRCLEKPAADSLRGLVLKFRGDLDGASAALHRAMESLRAAPHEGIRSSVTDQLAAIAMRRGDLARAEELYREAAEIARLAGRGSHAATSEVNGAIAALQRGALEGIEPDLRRAIRALELEDAKNLASHARLILAQCLEARGEIGEASRLTDQAIDQLRAAGYWLGLGDGLLMQGAHLAMAGRYEAAMARLEEAEALGARDGFLQVRVVSLAAQAKSLVALADPGEAGRRADACVRGARSTGDRAIRRAAACLLAEAEIMGLSPVGDLPALLDPADGTVAAAMIRAAEGWRCRDAGALHAAAARLRAPDVGERRAEMRTCADLLEVEALRIDGLAASAAALARSAHAEAARFGHAWLAAALDERR